MAARQSRYLTSHRAIREAIASGGHVGALYVTGGGGVSAELARAAREAGVDVRRVSRSQLRSLAADARDCALEPASGTEGRSASLAEVLERSDERFGLILVVDHVTDPHNYGAILRSADQFAVDAVVVPGRRSAPLSSVAIQSSAGTAPHVTIVTVTNLAAAVEAMQERGFWVYAAEMSGEPIHQTKLSGRTAVVLGSEGKGVSRLVADRADALVRIPTAGHADSLNVSVACGVALYEIRRQQGWLAEH